MVHPEGESVVRDHAGHCKQPLGLERGETRALAKNETVDVGTWQPNGIVRSQPDAVAGKAEIKGELGKSRHLCRRQSHRQLLLEFPHQRKRRRLAGFDRPSKAPPMVGIKDSWIGISQLHHVAIIRKLQQRGDGMGGPQRGPGAEKCTGGI